jgi:hypothetical protein
MTETIRKIASEDRIEKTGLGHDGNAYNVQHVWLSMMGFINPIVASLPEHAHLLAEPGGFLTKTKRLGKMCGGGVTRHVVRVNFLIDFQSLSSMEG